jgi:altronate dehydratase large subunit
MTGFVRSDGRLGIRNLVVVAYLVECAHHVSREIVTPLRDRGVHLIGFPGCYPNAYADRIMRQLCTHPNVGAVLLVSLGCESFHRRGLQQHVESTGRPCKTLVIQETGGTRPRDARPPWRCSRRSRRSNEGPCGRATSSSAPSAAEAMPPAD